MWLDFADAGSTLELFNYVVVYLPFLVSDVVVEDRISVSVLDLLLKKK